MSLISKCFFALLILFSSCSLDKKYEQPKPDKDNGGLILPDGFRALVVADSVGKARHLAVNNNNDIYVKLGITGGVDGSIALRDTNQDGRADIIVRFGGYNNDGKFATEMRIRKGFLYFSTEREIYRQKLTPPSLIPTSKLELLVQDYHPVQWHNAKSLAFDDNGGMYITFSAPTNACEDWTSVVDGSTANTLGYYPCGELIDHAGIWKFDDDKIGQTQKTGKKYASGLRSVVGISWNQKHNSLYAIQHGRDYLYNHAPQYFTPWMNANLPAEEFIKINEGDDFGWPYGYYDHFQNKRMIAPEYGGDGKRELAGYKIPLMGLPAHWSPNDLLFYKGVQFPKRYQEGAFVAFHGSTNRAPYPQAGYIVAFIPFKEGQPDGTWEVFADGFAGKDTLSKMDEALYRPVGLAEGPDGSLYIAEAKKGKIWRIIFSGFVSDFGTKNLTVMESRKLQTYIKTPDEIKDNLSLQDKVDGAELYSTYCQNCHQKNGGGVENIYPPISKSDWVNGDANRLIKSVLNGIQGEIKVNGKSYNHAMPAYPFLSDHQLAELLSFIKNNFENKGGRIIAGDVKQFRL